MTLQQGIRVLPLSEMNIMIVVLNCPGVSNQASKVYLLQVWLLLSFALARTQLGITGDQ